jgi:hypothetical protein
MTEYDTSLEEQNEQLRFKLAETEKLLDAANKLPQLHWEKACSAYVAENGNIYEDGYDLFLGKVKIGYMYKDSGLWHGVIVEEHSFSNFKSVKEIQEWMMDAFIRDTL